MGSGSQHHGKGMTMGPRPARPERARLTRRDALAMGGVGLGQLLLPPAVSPTQAAPYPRRALRKLFAANRAQLVAHLAAARPGDHIVLHGSTPFTGEAVEVAKSDIVIRGVNLLGATVRLPFRLMPGTRNVWLWGLRVVDVWDPFRVNGDDHMIGRCRVIRPGGITISLSRCNRPRVFACEFLGQMPWTAEEEKRGAADGQPLRMHIRYERDYPRDVKVWRCLFRGGLRRPVETSYKSGQPDFLEPGGGGNLGNTETRGLFEHLLMDNHPGYDLLPEGGAVFDFKTSKATARHITIKNTRGRIDIRVGQGCRFEGIWLDDTCHGTNIHGGNHVVNGWRGGRNAMVRMLSGDEEYSVSNRNHPRAYRCQLHHVDGDILLGYRELPLPPKDTRIYAQRSGTITYLTHEGTQVFPTSPHARVVPRELTEADVGCFWAL